MGAGEAMAVQHDTLRMRDRRVLGWSVSRWVTLLAAALVFSIVVALRNFHALTPFGPALPFRVVLANEIPVWLSWLALLPGIAKLAERFPPFGDHVVRNAGLHVAAGLASSFVTVLLVFAVAPFLPGSQLPTVREPGFWPQLWPAFARISASGLLIYSMIVGLVLTWAHHRAGQERQARDSNRAAMLVRNERDLWRMQTHPDFLFDTLHAIGAMVGDDPRGARQMVARLSDLLRLSFADDARHEVTLDEELELLRLYTSIQGIRFQGRLTVAEKVDGETRSKMIPRLLLQPLMANALQHGIAHMDEGGLVEVRACLESNNLVVEIANDGPLPLQDERRPRTPWRSGPGLGLRRTAARLHQMYGAAATVRLHHRWRFNSPSTCQTTDAGGGRVVAPARAGATVRVVIPARDHPMAEYPHGNGIRMNGASITGHSPAG